MDHEHRLKIYMGDLYHHPMDITLSSIPTKDRPMEFMYSSFMLQDFKIEHTSYYHDLTRYLHPLPKLHRTRFFFYPHDRVEGFKIPTLVKSRSLEDSRMSILCNFNTIRHFVPIFDVAQKDIPYIKKKDVLVWRGADTGPGFGNNIPHRDCSREGLIREYTNSDNPALDIALSAINSNQYTDQSEYTAFLRQSMNMTELLRHRFILSVEGNDVASNLKWILASDSVPFCPPFSIQSWILEDHLIPWTHYIPVRADFSDMEDRVEWAIHHPEACQTIAHEGKTYMNSFLDIRQETILVQELLMRYARNVRFKK